MEPFVEFDAIFTVARYAVVNVLAIRQLASAVASLNDLRSIRQGRILHGHIFPAYVVWTAKLHPRSGFLQLISQDRLFAV